MKVDSGCETKPCNACKQILPFDRFSPNPNGKHGRLGRCKNCHNKAARERHARNPQRAQAAQTRYQERHREKYLAAARSSFLKGKYGLTVEKYDEMLRAQNGGCAICDRGVSPGGRRLSVDHDHETDEVRGLLCSSCNSALGLLEEDPSRAQRLIAYISEHKGKNPSE